MRRIITPRRWRGPAQAVLISAGTVQTEVVVNPIDLSGYENLPKLPPRQARHPCEQILLFVGRLGKERTSTSIRLPRIADGIDAGHGRRRPWASGSRTATRDLGGAGDLCPFYAACCCRLYMGIFVFTSATDTQGMNVTEAMAASAFLVSNLRLWKCRRRRSRRTAPRWTKRSSRQLLSLS